MAGKGQSPKRKAAAKRPGPARKPAGAGAVSSTDASPAPDEPVEVSGASSDAAAPLADAPPRPQMHPLARMREASRSAGAGEGRPAGPIRHVTDLATTSYGTGHDAGTAWVESLRDHIRQQPVQSLLIAAGAGFLYGLASRR